MVTLTCDNCGQTFERLASKRRHDERIGRTHAYCSRACLAADGNGIESRALPEPLEGIPWLRPRNPHEEMLAEMIAGAALDYRDAVDGKGEQSEDYVSGRWAALIDYGRRIFEARDARSGGTRDNQSKAPAEGNAAPTTGQTALSLV